MRSTHCCGRPLVETLLFSVALAVGLSPELLPAILSVNLARGAQMHGRAAACWCARLNAIENLGSMDVLCTDKTGTLTEGVVSSRARTTPLGSPASACSSSVPATRRSQTGLANPLDDAILAGAARTGWQRQQARARSRSTSCASA